MLLRIRPESDEPIYEQIIHQIVFQVAAQVIDNGTLLPSIRELAKELLVNPNTVARAYQELERQGILAARRGMGMGLTEEAGKRCRELRAQRIRERIGQVVKEALHSGLEPDVLKAWIEDELSRHSARTRKEKR